MSGVAICHRFIASGGYRFVKNRTAATTIKANTTYSMIVFNDGVMVCLL